MLSVGHWTSFHVFVNIIFPSSDAPGFYLERSFFKKENDLLGAEMFKPVSIRTSSRVGVIGPWLNKKAFMASDQKKEADMSIGSFLTISDKDKFRH